MYYFNILFSIKIFFVFGKSLFCCPMKNLGINRVFMLEGNIFEEQYQATNVKIQGNDCWSLFEVR